MILKEVDEAAGMSSWNLADVRYNREAAGVCTAVHFVSGTAKAFAEASSVSTLPAIE